MTVENDLLKGDFRTSMYVYTWRFVQNGKMTDFSPDQPTYDNICTRCTYFGFVKNKD